MSYFDNIPLSVRIRTFIVTSAGFLLDGYDLNSISFAATIILKEFSLTTVKYGLLLAASLIGMIPGSIVFGWLSDKMGRSKIMGLDLFFFLVFGILTAISQNFVELFISRLLLGIGIGGDYPISSTLMSELSPSRSRGRYLTGSVAMYWVGVAISGIATLFLLPTGSYFWRYVFLIGALISVPIILLRLRLIESPRWLVSTGKANIKEINREIENKGVRGVVDLFKGKLLKITFFVTSVWFLFDVAAYGIGLYYPALLEEFAFPSKYEVVLGTLAIAAASVLGYIIAELLVDSLGRRVVLLVGLGFMTLLLYLGGIYKFTGGILVPYFMSFVALEQWAGAVTLFYPTELYPTPVRAIGQGFATAISRVGSVLGVFYFPILTKQMGFFNSLIMFGSVCLIAFIISILLSKETAKKPLEVTSEGVK
ncbi:MFS transporter [Saccharolobus solfataricus]|uniref:Sugar transport related protein n=3 Tax=Saccharolobus solfataricus TaxID=2287 RepID=Q7LX65_SACS2|nr:MFS transporter [Saccharolobus solfataricus]AAK42313.1 Sugar transport related protein [Saccharolobus solfataricus P2]AKA74928.1 MFS transporter [Saccharolobus solfataricus]AKA77624.1 MFS transporter [Saccharolobus solfataricus]AKA80315.1 MFS transporter [Saccharolobus solfataricus]AZF69392.1 MFS transporter [Saccharolobus solfataricus]